MEINEINEFKWDKSNKKSEKNRAKNKTKRKKTFSLAIKVKFFYLF